jgi:hypothetical protein
MAETLRFGEHKTSAEPRAPVTSPSSLIDLEEDKAAWAVVFGLLAEMERK